MHTHTRARTHARIHTPFSVAVATGACPTVETRNPITREVRHHKTSFSSSSSSSRGCRRNGSRQRVQGTSTQASTHLIATRTAHIQAHTPEKKGSSGTDRRLKGWSTRAMKHGSIIDYGLSQPSFGLRSVYV